MNKLREYKGVRYNPLTKNWHTEGQTFESAAQAICLRARVGPHALTDDDHAALMELKANPYELPHQTLERILSDCLQSKMNVSVVAEVIRSAFPQIDAPLTVGDAIKEVVAMGANAPIATPLWTNSELKITGEPPYNSFFKQPLIAADHINALVAMGAIRQPQTFLFIGKPDETRDVLILPPEMTP